MSVPLHYVASRWNSWAVKVLLGNNGSQWPTPSRTSPPHHNGLQEADDGAEATPLLHEGPAHRLLLRLLHQQTQVRHILHGAVQLGLQVHSPWGGGRGWRENTFEIGESERVGSGGNLDGSQVWRAEEGWRKIGGADCETLTGCGLMGCVSRHQAPLAHNALLHQSTGIYYDIPTEGDGGQRQHFVWCFCSALVIISTCYYIFMYSIIHRQGPP